MKSLFTNVPLDKTKDFVLKKGVQRKENPNIIPKTALKGYCIFAANNYILTFNKIIYKICDGVVMGSPLGSLIANIFMTSLKEDLI